MSDHDSDPNPPLSELIDRLVDGGLTPAQLRLAIDELDRAPDGWRRCALAFLEAQCWSESFRHLDQTVANGYGPLAAGSFGDRPAISVSSPIPIASPPRRRWIGVALAAGVSLVAFSLGWLGHSLRSGVLGERPPETPIVATSEPLATDGGGPPATDGSSGLPDPGSIATLPAARLPTIREVARLRVGSGDPDAAEVPLLAGPGISPRWLLEQPPPISEHGRAAWRRRGYQLEQHRRLVSIPLGDGRRAAVPIDQVQVRYVGQDPL
jgi:hypothetical protein